MGNLYMYGITANDGAQNDSAGCPRLGGCWCADLAELIGGLIGVPLTHRWVDQWTLDAWKVIGDWRATKDHRIKK